ncbi:MAG: transketolase [Alphaproteobacteria bacterium]
MNDITLAYNFEHTFKNLNWSPFMAKAFSPDKSQSPQVLSAIKKAAEIRLLTMRTMLGANYGHPASSLGLADFFAAVYFGGGLRHNPANPMWRKRDRLFVSCGHISAVIYATLAKAGYFDESCLESYTKLGSPLTGHPSFLPDFGIENASGSLGQGISLAVGSALSLKNSSEHIFLLTSDGEQQEGQIWEALLCVNKYKLSNLTIFIDCNGIQNTGTTDEIMPLGNIKDKYASFGFNVIGCNGHNVEEIINTCLYAKKSYRPVAVCLRTTPGKGVSFMENNPKWHGDLPAGKDAQQALYELEQGLNAV